MKNIFTTIVQLVKDVAALKKGNTNSGFENIGNLINQVDTISATVTNIQDSELPKIHQLIIDTNVRIDLFEQRLLILENKTTSKP